MKTFIIAEAGVNHNGSLLLAKKLVNIAYECGADAVKFQTFRAEDLVCAHAPKADYQNRTTANSESQYHMLKKLELSEEDQLELSDYCQQKKILFLSSPFNESSVDFLVNKLDISLIKIPSGEITNLPLLLKIARTHKPVILSTGMSTLGEIEMALGVLAYGYTHARNSDYPSPLLCEEAYANQDILKQKVSLLHCTTEYPAPFTEVNLRAIKTLQTAFDLPVGYSDHTLGTAVSIAAVALGSTLIEKHFTLDKSMSGPDHQASLDPQELASLVTSIRQVEKSLGTCRKIPTESEVKNRLIARKSLVALQPIQCGDLFTEKNLGCKRPGSGLSPAQFYHFKDKYADRDYKQEELIGI